MWRLHKWPLESAWSLHARRVKPPFRAVSGLQPRRTKQRCDGRSVCLSLLRLLGICPLDIKYVLAACAMFNPWKASQPAVTIDFWELWELSVAPSPDHIIGRHSLVLALSKDKRFFFFGCRSSCGLPPFNINNNIIISIININNPIPSMTLLSKPYTVSNLKPESGYFANMNSSRSKERGIRGPARPEGYHHSLDGSVITFPTCRTLIDENPDLRRVSDVACLSCMTSGVR